MKTLNNYYAEAEKIGGQSYLEGCLACATAYLIFLCMETRYEKVRIQYILMFWDKLTCSLDFILLLIFPLPSVCQVLKKIAKYIQEQNEKIYAPRGLLITDPIERGMRVVSLFWILGVLQKKAKQNHISVKYLL